MALTRRASAAWERFGQQDPYFAVCVEERFQRGKLDDAACTAFFHSGEEHVEQLLATIRQHLESGFAPTRALDFGCGVGRLTTPLARVCRRVVGVDVSAQMLQEAWRNCEAFGVRNVELAVSDDRLSAVGGSFDFVHPFIVFQHIPPRRGEAILRAMLERLEEHGVGALHCTYHRRASRLRRSSHWLRKHVPFINPLVNVLRGNPPAFPLIPMHNYSLNRLFHILHECCGDQLLVRLTDHGGHEGVFLFFRKRGPASAGVGRSGWTGE